MFHINSDAIIPASEMVGRDVESIRLVELYECLVANLSRDLYESSLDNSARHSWQSVRRKGYVV